ncbi:hypothetical protein ONE63_005099 [Megalurothrips usitatus]|uniref:Uncharacterized protein n=1 Tax=Megalurothrips usitatus TaxID=439358 RepID=A0AAV7XUD6_9NEOP|nr:hypothetical protein ONE63_005099 [Megalurothrips usitatus]
MASSKLVDNEEEWYLLFTETHNAYDLVHRSAIIAVGDIAVADTVTFHKNKPFVGKVTEKSGSYDDLNKILSDLGSKARHVVSKKKGKDEGNIPASTILDSRRTRRQTAKYSSAAEACSSSHTKRKSLLSEEEARKRRLRELNEATAVKKTNASVMESLMKNKGVVDKDPDYKPEDSEDSDIRALVQNAKKRKEDRMSGFSGTSPIGDKSPTKEFYKQKYLDMQRKLQFMYDKHDSEKDDTETREVTGASDAENIVTKENLATSPRSENMFGGEIIEGGDVNRSPSPGNVSERSSPGRNSVKDIADGPSAEDITPASKKGKRNSLFMVEQTPELDFQLRGAGEVTLDCNFAYIRNVWCFGISVLLCLESS